jgi:hypothetical protein
MASNKIPIALPDLVLHSTEAFQGAENHGDAIPIVVNNAELIGADRQALLIAQEEYQAARSALVTASQARKDAHSNAWDFCSTVRDVLIFFFGRHFNNSWLDAGWEDSLRIPDKYSQLYMLVNGLVSFFTLNPTKENAALGVTAAHAQTLATAMQSTNQGYLDAQAFSFIKRDIRDAKAAAMRKRLSSLCKELSMHLDDLDPRWLWFGFNMPGAPTTPAVPENLVAAPLSGARLQLSCDPSVGATSYRFYAQRPILDPVPLPVGTSYEPLLITDPLTVGQEYLVYVTASNEGAESPLSTPVTVTAVAAAAA